MYKKDYYGDLLDFNIDAHTPNVAAIDLGTTSCRLLIASINVVGLQKLFKIKLSTEKDFKVIDSYARVVGLGEGVKQTGLLSKNAMDKTIEVLKICKKKMEHNRVCKLRAVATEASRQAENSSVLLERVNAEIGIDLEIISPKEEARLVLGGCYGVMSHKKKYAIVLDIGGGSAEIVWVRIKGVPQDRNSLIILDSMSLPYGVVTLRDSYLYNQKDTSIYSVTEKAIKQLIQFFLAKNKINNLLNREEVQIIASSGSFTTLCSLVLGVVKYDRDLVDGKEFLSNSLIKMAQSLLKKYLESSEEKLSPGIELDFLKNRLDDRNAKNQSVEEIRSFMYSRLGLLASGSVIIKSILEALGNTKVRIADRGIREGIINDMVYSFKFPY